MSIENRKPKTEGQVRAEERARLATILEHPNAEERPKVALKMALYTPLAAEAVIEMLADLPAEKEPRHDASAFLAAMQKEGSTGVASALGSAPVNSAKERRLAEIRDVVSSYNLAQGYISPQQAAARGVVVRGL